SGDQTGPAPPRVSIDRFATGTRQTGSALRSDRNTATWLVPSRKLFENGRDRLIATCLPSADHVGRPGCPRLALRKVTSPSATFTTPSCATPHMPSTAMNATREPSGDQTASSG